MSTLTLPRRLLPMLATSTEPFDDPAYLFEVKWDGVRALAAVDHEGVRLWGREGVNYSGRYPELDELHRLPAGTMLDGELVMMCDGRPDFHALMSRRHSRRPRKLPYFAEPIRYVVFDLLSLGDRSLLDRPLSERRELLRETLPESRVVFPCEGVFGKGRSFFKKVVAAGHEGVVAKRLSSRYVPNQRSRVWRKIKQKIALPCVVIGYHLAKDGLRDLVMAAVIDGKLSYIGTVELGLDGAAVTIEKLEALRTARPVVPVLALGSLGEARAILRGAVLRLATEWMVARCVVCGMGRIGRSRGATMNPGHPEHQTTAPAIECISAITLATHDMARAVHFYRSLGFVLLYGGEDASFTSFAAGSSYLNLIAQPPERCWSWWGRVIFYVADVDALYERARAAGLHPEHAPRDAPWGERFFHLTDPDGHEISFARPLSTRTAP